MSFIFSFDTHLCNLNVLLYYTFVMNACCVAYL
jgi:hypothetical protein